MNSLTEERKYTSAPLFLRNLVLRLLLTSVIVNVASTITFLVPLINSYSQWEALPWFEYLALPILVAVHHISRLWSQRYWLVICEVLLSLGEVAAVGVIVIPRTTTHLKTFKERPFLHSPYVAMEVVSSVLMSASVFIACFFLLCDIVHDHGKNILRPYEFSAGQHEAPHRWKFIWGTSTTKKRFITDTIFLQCVRGGVAILCLLVTSYLVLYVVIWEPLQRNGHPRTKVSRSPVPDGNLQSALATLLPQVDMSEVFALLTLPTGLPPHQYPNVTLQAQSFTDKGCNQNVTVEEENIAFASCPVQIPSGNSDTFDIIVTIYFADVLGDFRLYLGMGFISSMAPEYTEAIGISPGYNLHGWGSISIKQLLESSEIGSIAYLGIGKIPILNVRTLSPDPSPLLPRVNNTATLRTTITSQQYIEIEQEYLEVPVLNGIAIVGGVWTFMSGVFAAVFGSTLVHVLFGIKPLSVYGLAQSFHQEKRLLVEAKRTLSPEERDRIVSLLKEHLLDADINEGDEAPPSQYSSISILPRSRRSESDN